MTDAVLGLKPYQEGDDPRKLDPVASAALDMDIAREYEEQQLATVVVVTDPSASVAALPEVRRAAALTSEAVAESLSRGGHKVNQAASVGPKGRRMTKGPLLSWARAEARSGAAFGHAVVVTDAAWPVREYRRFIDHLSRLAEAGTVVVLARDVEFDDPGSYMVSVPGSDVVLSAPRRTNRGMHRLLRRLARDTGRFPRFALSVVRWADTDEFLSRLAGRLRELCENSE